MNTQEVMAALQGLLTYGKIKSLIKPVDEVAVRNGILDLLHLSNWETPTKESQIPWENAANPDAMLDVLASYAVKQEILEPGTAAKERFETRIMGYLTPYPREIIEKFQRLYLKSPKDATDWYYDFSRDVNYVRTGAISKNLCWQYNGTYGQLDITLNLSMPEKDPRDIAAAKLQPKTNYPACQLCFENMGFAGTATHPARQNLRPIPLEVGGEDWFLQYSPYGYYHEHCIVFRSTHIPMKIDDAVFGKLFDVLDFLPHYFIGSNADLPIVGGSILSHEHFQGGNFTFAMAKAPIESPILLPRTPSVEAGILHWPMSVLRLRSENRVELEQACSEVLHAWRQYCDDTVEIFAETNGIPHNTITPIARKRGKAYECDLVLRNNRTTPERPLGLFHPRPELHHIKKENIGLIEVMGLAVLPARLAGDLPLMAQALVEGTKLENYQS